MEHITFEDEIIMINHASAVGPQTIRKYKLDSETLDLLRGKHLREFQKVLIVILQNRRREKRSHLNAQELELLSRFQQTDQPFSLMFKILFSRHPIAEM
jgi:hypothetical protein